MTDATADTQVDMRAVRDTMPSSAPPKRESLVHFPPDAKVHTIEKDADQFGSREDDLSESERTSLNRTQWEIVTDELSEMRADMRKIVAAITRIEKRGGNRDAVVAGIANEVICMRMAAAPRALSKTELAGVVVLLVDDEPEVLEALRRPLQDMGATVYWADSEFQARVRLEKIGSGKIDCAILDMVLRDEVGTGLAQRIRRDRPDCGLVFMSGYGITDYKDQAADMGAQMLAKPFSVDALRHAVLEAATRNL